MRYLPLDPRPLAGVVAVVALLAAGCGGATAGKNDYVKQLNQAQASMQQSLSGAGAAVGSADPAAKLEASGHALDAAAEDFNRIEPPQDAKHAHGRIVAGLHQVAGTFRQAAKAAEAKDLTKLAKTFENLDQSPGLRELQKAQDELKANGYKIDES